MQYAERSGMFARPWTSTCAAFDAHNPCIVCRISLLPCSGVDSFRSNNEKHPIKVTYLYRRLKSMLAQCVDHCGRCLLRATTADVAVTSAPASSLPPCHWPSGCTASFAVPAHIHSLPTHIHWRRSGLVIIWRSLHRSAGSNKRFLEPNTQETQ